MRVLFILENDFPPNIRVENEISILKEYGHSFDVITFTQDKNAEPHSSVDGVNVYRYYINQLYYKSKVAQFKYPVYNWFWKKCLKNHLSKHADKYDAVHAVDLSTLPAAIWAKKNFKLPLILDLFENYPYLVKNADHTQSGLGKYLADFDKILNYENQNLKHADVVITTAPQMTDRLLAKDNRPERYFLYRNVIDITQYKSLPKVNPTIDLLYVGGITSARGIQQVIQATAEVIKQVADFKFYIVGAGRYVGELKRLAESLNVTEHVIFAGKVSQHEAFDYINQSKICVIPHLRSKQNDNTTSNKIFQYSFHEKAVLSTDAPATVSLVDEMKNGLIYEEGNIQELTEKIVFLLKNEDQLAEFGKNGKEAVLNKFNTKIEGKMLNEAYVYLEKNIITH